MTGTRDGLVSAIRRWTLLLGVLQITVGCLVGLIPPSAVQWFRGIVMAHIEYTANGVLMIAFGGTWTNGTAGVVGAFLGASSPLMPTLNEKFPAPHGADSGAVTGLLQACAVTILVALGLTLYGLVRRPLQPSSPR